MGPGSHSSFCFGFACSGGGSHANWHRIALQTAAEERRGRPLQQGETGEQQQQPEEEEPRTPAYGGGLSSQARRRSPV